MPAVAAGSLGVCFREVFDSLRLPELRLLGSDNKNEPPGLGATRSTTGSAGGGCFPPGFRPFPTCRYAHIL